MKKLELMNVYISNLAILNIKLHNLHWNITGVNFMQIHLKTEELYTDFFLKYDVIAEQIKMLGFMPMATTKDYIENSTIEEVEVKNFTIKEVLNILDKDLSLMKNLATEIRKEADEDDDFTTVAIFETHTEFYAKELWFIKAMLK